MKNWLNKFIHEAREVRLTAREKRAMLSAIIGPARIPSPYSFFLAVVEHRHRLAVAAMFAAVVITSGGTSFAASGALPGEALYSIKVNINEEIQSFVAPNPTAKAKVEVSRTEKRLEEAESLSKSGKLNAKTQAIIETNLERHSNTLKASIATLADEEAAATVKEVISGLNSTIEVREAVLSDLASSSASSTGGHLDAVIEKVNKVKKEIDDIGKDVEDKDQKKKDGEKKQKEKEENDKKDSEEKNDEEKDEEDESKEDVATSSVSIIFTTTTTVVTGTATLSDIID